MFLFAATTSTHGIGSFSTLLTILGSVLIIAAGAGMVLAYVRTSLAKTTIDLQAEQITAQSQRIRTLEDDQRRSLEHAKEVATKYEETIKSLEARVVSLENSLRIVEGIKSGTEAVQTLAAELQRKHDEQVEVLKGNTQLLHEISDYVKGTKNG